MSDFSVDIVEIDEVSPHPNADRLDLVVVGGWQVCARKDQYKAGDKVIYIEPDSMLPSEWAGYEKFGISQYCQLREVDGETMYRVRQVRLRGENSFGSIQPLSMLPDGEYNVGDDVSEIIGAKKFEPPLMIKSGKMEGVEHVPTEFQHFTTIQNARKQKYLQMFENGEDIICTEKIHGTQVRLGLVEGEWFAASKKIVRAAPQNESDWKHNFYWYPYTVPGVKEMMESLSLNGKHSVMVFGETFGKVQSMKYGLEDKIRFRVFGIMRDGKFLNHANYVGWCTMYDLDVTPVVYEGPFDIKIIAEIAEGETLIDGAESGHIREGVVIQPLHERTNPKFGRVILKYVSDSYLMGKHGEEDTTDE
jgi:RNA ligase (TIGR02306 family)